MNSILKLKSILTLVILSVLIFSCSSDDNDDIQGPDQSTDLEIVVNATNEGSTERDLNTTTTNLNSTVKVNVTFESTEPMRRLYITKSENGGANEPFIFTNQEVDEKADGSIDLKSDNKTDFTFNIDFDTPSNANGTVTYLLWATSGRGDFRDITKRNSINDLAFGTITITAGNGATGNGIKSFTQTILAAPLKDGSSDSFISLFNSTIYKINQGEEFAAFWDFGYYYGATGNASFASAADYPELFDVNNDGILDSGVSGISGVPQAELNNFYFAESTISFDAVTTRAALDGIVQSNSQRITNLQENDEIEFVDSYGNKGIIKVTEIVPGDGTNGQITFDVKVQTSTLVTIKP